MRSSKLPARKVGCTAALTAAVFSTLTAGLVPGLPARAQEAPEDEVLVTATRTETPAWQIGSSFSLITAQDIEASQAIVLSDVLRRQVGMSVSRAGGPGGVTSVFTRGANSGRTVVMIDGVEVNDPAASDNLFNFAGLPVDNIERVEIVRGPQSVLYGSKAMGGVINIITKQGQSGLSVSGSAEYGSFNSIRGTVRIGGRQDRIDYSLSGTVYDSDGISAADAADGNTEKDGIEDYSLSGRLGVDVSEIARLEGHFLYNAFDTEFDPTFPALADGDNRSENDQITAGGRIVLDLLGGRLETEFKGGYSELSRDSITPSSIFTAEGTRSELSIQATGRIAADHVLIAGAEHEEERMDTLFSSSFGDTPSAGKANTDSLFAQYQATFGGLTLNAGVRLDDHAIFGDTTTLRFTGAYRMDRSGTILRASYSEGFEAPSLFALFDPFSGNPDLMPEKSQGVDVGIEQRFLADRVTVQLTYFHIDFDNLIDFDFTTFSFNNVASAGSEGVEFVIDAALSETIDLSGNYTYNPTRDKSLDPAPRLLRRPTHTINAALSYNRAGKWGATLEARYVGDKRDIGDVRIDDYVLFELRGRATLNDRVELFGRIENLLDENYQEITGFGTPGLSAFGGVRARF